ncbi:GntR family transcriptional regulator [Rhodococcus jostii]|uniref:DNA-binding transcriptional regulator, GntR family n=1 Tax=Rhodococcus jostii TaxID=132919 RepID=A0A1H4IST0_RHOJO|nr:GntR family transcriptional regulator [Rhodococcus jostii]SEB37077.1 DNA-binding transcriptional regulator, GntR family [Rhodococcus jostii]
MKSAETAAATRTAHEEVIESLRRLILSGELAPGARLVQTALAKRLGVSSTPVREALRDLTAEGLVDFDAFRGAVVNRPTLDELEEIYDMRAALTPLSVKRSVLKSSPEAIAEAEAIALRMPEAEIGAWIEDNHRFHLLLEGSGKESRLVRTQRNLADISALYVGASVSEHSDRARAESDHLELVRAYRDRDLDRAVGITLSHLRTTLEAARRTFALTQKESS